MLLDMPAASACKRYYRQRIRRARQVIRPERLSRRGQNIEALIAAPQTADVWEAPFKELHQVVQFWIARLVAHTASSNQLAHRHGGVGHAVREAPFVVVPGEHAHQRAVD